MTTTVAHSSSRETVVRFHAQLGDERDELILVVDGIDIDYEIKLWDDTVTTLIDSAFGTISSSRGPSTGTLTAATLGDDVVVEALIRRVSAVPVEGILYGVRVLEVKTEAADLPG